VLERAQRASASAAPSRAARGRADAGASDGRRHARRGQGPQHLRTTYHDDSEGKISKPNEFGNLVTIQESEHQIITAYEVHAGRPADVTCGRQPWTDTRPSSRARRISRPAIGASARRPTTRPPLLAACDASSCLGGQPNPAINRHRKTRH
jgi:hypothetical protein